MSAKKTTKHKPKTNMSNHTAAIVTQQGYTGKDHLLPEIKRVAEESMKAGYSSKAAARKAAERAWFRTCRDNELYSGCGAGFRRAV